MFLFLFLLTISVSYCYSGELVSDLITEPFTPIHILYNSSLKATEGIDLKLGESIQFSFNQIELENVIYLLELKINDQSGILYEKIKQNNNENINQVFQSTINRTDNVNSGVNEKESKVEEKSIIIETPMKTPVTFISFSNTGRFLLSWNRMYSSSSSSQSNNRDQETEVQDNNNLVIWDLKITSNEKSFSFIPQIIAKFTQKLIPDKLSWYFLFLFLYNSLYRPTIKWSKDDKIAARMVTNEVQFFYNNNFNIVVGRIKLQDIKQITLSPNEIEGIKIAAFIPEKKGAPASVKIYSCNEASNLSFDLVASKSFFKAQETEMIWNPKGTSLLIKTHTDIDNSGKSYYGESGIFYLQADGSYDSSISLSK